MFSNDRYMEMVLKNLLCLNTMTWGRLCQISFSFVPTLAKYLNKLLIFILFVFGLPLRLVNPECSVTCRMQVFLDISGGFKVGSLPPPHGVWLGCTDEIFKMCSRQEFKFQCQLHTVRQLTQRIFGLQLLKEAPSARWPF